MDFVLVALAAVLTASVVAMGQGMIAITNFNLVVIVSGFVILFIVSYITKKERVRGKKNSANLHH